MALVGSSATIQGCTLCDLAKSAPASRHFAIISWNNAVTMIKLYNDNSVNGTCRIVLYTHTQPQAVALVKMHTNLKKGRVNAV